MVHSSLQMARMAVASLAIVTLGACKTRPTGEATLNAAPTKAHDLGTYACGQEPVKVAFFDADSTLRVSRSGKVSANAADDVYVLPFVATKIAELNRQGYLVAVVSNQGGVEQGIITMEVAEGALATTARLIGELGGRIDYLSLAPKNDEDRKPKTGMATRLAALLKERCGQTIDFAASFMVGDSGYKRGKDGPHPDGRPADDFSNADRGFAKNLLEPDAPDGVPSSRVFQEPTDYFGWKEFGVFNIENHGELEDFIESIEARAASLRVDGGASTARADALDREVAALRRVNGLTPRFRFVHYNIKELTTQKLLDGQSEQVNTAAAIIRDLGPDLLSINEIQYDQPDVPTPGLPGTGENMRRLLARTGIRGAEGWSTNLAPANTGKRARKKADGSYHVDPNGPGAAAAADVVSFGTFPGQYSTGFATPSPVLGKTILTDITWQEWDNKTDFASLTLSNGQPAPSDMELLDKNFNDVTVELGGRPVHVVTFHTVPAFGFGGSADLNIARNKAQLEFLEWYLLGECEPDEARSAVKRCATAVRPLADNTPFLVVGDLNVDWGTPGGGAEVLARLLKDQRIHAWRAPNPDHAFTKEPDAATSFVTYMSDGVDLGKLQSELDYFLVSKHFRIASGKVSAPLSWYKEHDCHAGRAAADAQRSTVQASRPDKAVSVSTRYGAEGTRSYCVVEVSKEFAAFRRGSDHLPLYVTFSWADL